MLTLYVVSAVVAGVLLIFSLVGADHSGGHEFHIEHGSHDSDHALGHGRWVPFLSLRFYTYFFAGLGGTGLLVHYLTTTPENFTLWLSISVGLLSGFGASILVRMLRLNETSSATTEKDLLGSEGQVLVPIRGTTPGRIRCTIKGDSIDFIAVCDDPATIPSGAGVIIVAIENGRALVMRRETVFGEDQLSVRTS